MVSYDIPKDNESYSKITGLLKDQLKAQRVLESQWLLRHDGDSREIIKTLKTHIQEGDRLLVQKLTDDTSGENLQPLTGALKNLFDEAEKRRRDRTDVNAVVEAALDAPSTIAPGWGHKGYQSGADRIHATTADKEKIVETLPFPYPEYLEVLARSRDQRLNSPACTQEDKREIEAEYERKLDRILAARTA